MAQDWQTQEAEAQVEAFLAAHPEYTRKGVPQPGQGSTNRVFFARVGGDRVVLKVFCEVERRAREGFGLRHWAETGLVPKLIYEDGATLIVMSRLPGMYLGRAREVEGDEAWRAATRETGQATGALTRVPLAAAGRQCFESRFYSDVPTLADYLARVLALGRGINGRDPDFREAYWTASLDFLEAEVPGLLAQPAALYHQDVSNLHVEHGRFVGFFDLEMCRVGCAAMQLGSALRMLDGDSEAWASFAAGWVVGTGQALDEVATRAAAAVAHLLSWREISRYLSYDGTPGSGYEWADPQDPDWHRARLEGAEAMLGVVR
jgi:Ser/Thr protein kinase RdoA (MazF antagonist)